MDLLESIFPLRIFPADSLAASVTTTVWVGVWVVAYFNLRLGWVASGLVVPGYLVPLLLVRPWTVFAIYVESAVTFGVVYVLSESFHTRKPWSSFFGRDRFFALVLVSILVRAVFDGWLFPQFGAWINSTFAIHFDYHSNLHSFGLIIVSLLANYYWKPGLFRGTLSMSIMVGLSLLIVRFGLMEFTNFSLGNLQYMYEDIATSLLASPRVYIILVVSAFIASWMNLYYGWDFNGILIPSLLALQWNEPKKLLFSFAEATIVLVIASVVMKLPPMRKMTMEGTRKILLFFNVMFAYRLALGHIVSVWFPDTAATDVFGFGFLLSTLLAVKAHQKGMLLRLMRATAQISLVGSLCGSMVGFALILPAMWGWRTHVGSASPDTESRTQYAARDAFTTIMLQDLVRHETQRTPGSCRLPMPTELMNFEAGLRELLQTQTDSQAISRARPRLAAANYEVHQTRDGMLVLSESEPVRGWGSYALRWKNRRTLHPVTIEIPLPLDEDLTLETGLVLFRQLHADRFAVGGTTRGNLPNRAADVVRQPETMINVFHRVAGENALQVRALQNTGLLHPQAAECRTTLWIQNGIPQGLNLKKLQQVTGPLSLHWETPRSENVQRRRSVGPFLELGVPMDVRVKLLENLSHAVPADSDLELARTEPSDTTIHEFLRDRRTAILPALGNSYRAPTAGELLAFDRRLLRPLLRLCREHASLASIQADDPRDWQRIRFAAHVLGWTIRIFPATDEHSAIAALYDARERGWGTCIVRMSTPPNLVLAVPRPIQERHVVDYSIQAFDVLEAAALVLSGTHPLTNADGSADLSKTRNVRNHFQLMQQALLRSRLREMAPFSPSERAQRHAAPMFVHIRSTHSLTGDVLLADRSGIKSHSRQQRLQKRLEQSGVSVRLADGSLDTVGYEPAGAFAALARTQSDSIQFVNLWLGDTFRRRFRPVENDSAAQAEFDILKIPTIEADLAEYLREHSFGKWRVSSVQAPIDHARDIGILRDCIGHWLTTQDVIRLRNLQLQCPQVHWQRIVSRRFRQAFLIGQHASGCLLPCVVRLTEPPRGSLREQILNGRWTQRDVRAFEESQATFLLVDWERSGP